MPIYFFQSLSAHKDVETILNCVIEGAKKLTLQSIYRIVIQSDFSGISCTTSPLPLSGIYNDAKLGSVLSALKENSFIGLNSLSVAFNSPSNHQHPIDNIDIKIVSPGSSYLKVTFDHFSTPQECLLVVNAFLSRINLFKEGEYANKNEETLIGKASGQFEHVSSVLSRSVADIAKSTSENIDNVERKILELSTRLSSEFESKRISLEKEHDENRSLLAHEKEEFEKRKAEFDDRERIHVRRNLLAKIEEIISERKTLSYPSQPTKSSFE